jgi:glutamate-1-semialdehyde 2,1-aminomutase
MQRTTSSRETELLKKAVQYMPGGSNGNSIHMNVVIERGEGSKVWDVSGNEYVDYALGSGPMFIGHAHPKVVEAVREQVSKSTTFFALSEEGILLAEEICKAVPVAEEVRYASGGSEATLFAMRAARAYRGRDKILKFEGGYHGMNDYALMSLAPSKPADYPQPVPDSAGIPKSVQGEVLVAPFNDLETTAAIIDKYHDEIGGVIVEAFQRVISPLPGFLEGLREITLQYGIPLIFDEIVTGFRLSYGGAQQQYGVIPDLCSLGKIVGGGFPLSAVAGKKEFMQVFDSAHYSETGPMPQVGTLNGNPVASAAGLATLEVLRGDGVYEQTFARGRRLREGFQQILDQAEIPAQLIGHDTVFDVYFTEDDKPISGYRDTLKADKQKMLKLNNLLLDRGIFKGESKYYVSTAHSDEDIDRTLDIFKSAVDEL